MVPRPEFVSERKSPTASQDESGATTDNPITELLRTITENLEEVDQHLADRDKRIGDLRRSPAVITLTLLYVEKQSILRLDFTHHH